MKNKAPKKVSLEQLYQQRKANHKLPDALRERLLKKNSTPKTKRINKWQIAMPIAFASVMTIVVIYPDRDQLNKEYALVPSMQDQLYDDIAEAPLSASEVEVDIMLELEDVAPVFDSSASARGSISAPAMKIQEPSVIYSTASPAIIHVDNIEGSNKPLILLVINGSQGEFKNCEDKIITLQGVKTELQGWVSATNQDDQWIFEALDQKLDSCMND